MEAQLVKREDRYDLYDGSGHKIASTLDGAGNKLSLKNCQAIERGYDLDELLDNITPKNGTIGNISERIGFVKGFQKALELMGDKKFSEDDVRKAMGYMFEQTAVFGNKVSASDVDRCIQSLQQTEWEVEIEMTKEEYIWTPPGEGFEDQAYRDWREVPKLDATGCLILKLKL